MELFQRRTPKQLTVVSPPADGFTLIYADPPWAYAANTSKRKLDYGVMSLHAIKNMPIPSISAKSCALALWVTSPLLSEGLDVIKAWGFTFKGILFTWVKTCKPSKTADGLPVLKPHFGCGSYTRGNCELLLLATRGRDVAARVKGRTKLGSRSVYQIVITEEGDLQLPRDPAVILAPRKGHSIKPAAIQDRLEQLFGDYEKDNTLQPARMLELFARTSQRKDWYYFGNEVVKYKELTKNDLYVELKRKKKLANGAKRAEKRKRNLK
jgi:N6-adenosine-specific RNA methylase IME4